MNLPICFIKWHTAQWTFFSDNTINHRVTCLWLCKTALEYRCLTGVIRSLLTPNVSRVFCDLPHWWETVDGWRLLHSRADSNTPRLDDQTWKVLCQGTYSTTNGMFHQTACFCLCRQPSMHWIYMRQPRTTASAFEGNLLLTTPDSKVMTSATWLPARKENGTSTVTFVWSTNRAWTYSSRTTRLQDFTLSDTSHSCELHSFVIE